MKKCLILCLVLLICSPARAWWDAGHMVVAMIAYRHLSEPARAKADQLTKVLQRDYPYLNHFSTLGPWPDDLKAEGVTLYSPMHYTNLPYNPRGVALPPQPKVNIVWAIDEALKVLRSPKARDIEKARQLGFLVHFTGDLHQPLHTTSYYTNDRPSGNRGGNDFPISTFGKWRNLHSLWDDGCGYLSAYNDINPYGDPKESLLAEEVQRLEQLARQIEQQHPKESLQECWILDRDFWVLEGHKLAIRYGYEGVQKKGENGWDQRIKPNDAPSEYYLEQGQKVVQRRLALAGYRLAELLNEAFGEE
ncbi:MAG: S1/P1 nuclease [Bacteroidota bacterium]